MVLARVLALPELLDPPVGRHLVDVGELAVQPGGVGGRRRAEEGLNAVPPERFDGLAQPVEIERAVGRLHPVPGELAHADADDARLLHQFRIDRPALDRPVFGVVIDSKQHEDSPERRQRSGTVASTLIR
jgi:hypothetical protein